MVSGRTKAIETKEDQSPARGETHPEGVCFLLGFED